MAKKNVPSSVRVSGVQNPVSVVEGKITTKETDPLKPIKTSPYAELLPASEEWVKKYGGSDNSIVAYNVAVLLKEKASGKDTSGNRKTGNRKTEDGKTEDGKTEDGKTEDGKTEDGKTEG